MAIDMNLSKPQRILLAAEQVFSVYGFEKATLDEIIALADVGKGTVYRYFGNKEQLFFRLVDEKNRGFVERLECAVAAQAGIEGKLLKYFEELVAFYRANASLWQIIFFEMLCNGRYILKEGINGELAAVPRYAGMKADAAEQELLLRYYRLIVGELDVFKNLIREGIVAGSLKDCNVDISCRFFFFGVVMSIFNPTGDSRESLSNREASDIIVDRYLNGERL